MFGKFNKKISEHSKFGGELPPTSLRGWDCSIITSGQTTQSTTWSELQEQAVERGCRNNCMLRGLLMQCSASPQKSHRQYPMSFMMTSTAPIAIAGILS